MPGLLARGARTVINAFWLGLLSEDSLRALDERYYAREGVYRTEQWNERGLFEWEERLVRAHLERGKRVVVPAAGGGREVLALAESGFDAIGFEPHVELAEFGRGFLASRGHGDRIRNCARDEFPAVDEPVDGVLVGWGAYSLIHGRDRRVRFLAAARGVLAQGAPLLLSFFDRPGGGREAAWTAAAANWLRRMRGAPPVERGDTLAPNRVHVFTREQLVEEAAAARFELASYEIVQSIDETTRYASAALTAA